MFNQKRGFISGFITCALLCVLVMNVFAAPIEKTIKAAYNNIRIVVDNKEIKPTDANGNAVEPFIVNGTTYLPVRAVATALGKEVYWDGPNYTVYLGNMNGKLEYPSLRLEDAVNISGGESYFKNSNGKTDNYGNTYTVAHYFNSTGYGDSGTFQTILNMKYSRFKGTAYISAGTSQNGSWTFWIENDGKIIYTSPPMTKTSSPVNIDLDITGCNDFKLICECSVYGGVINFGDCGFYQ